MALNTSPQMRHMIEEWEGLRLQAYQDSVGVWTIGYGHTGPDVHEGQDITDAMADQLMSNDLHKFELAVGSMLDGAPTTQQQFDALVSFAYNLGAGALKGSSLLRLHQEGQYGLAAAQFALWCHAGGEVLEGLVKRRAGEAAVYLTGAYTS
jgi:lysozyme